MCTCMHRWVGQSGEGMRSLSSESRLLIHHSPSYMYMYMCLSYMYMHAHVQYIMYVTTIETTYTHTHTHTHTHIMYNVCTCSLAHLFPGSGGGSWGGGRRDVNVVHTLTRSLKEKNHHKL